MPRDIVLLHGWGANANCWGTFSDSLVDANVHCINLPGFGGRAFDPAIIDTQTYVDAIVDELPDDAFVIGWSLGGMLATQLAYQYPQKVCGLVLMASNPKFTGEFSWPGMPEETLDKFAEDLLGNTAAILKRFIALQFFGIKSSRELVRSAQSWANIAPDNQALQIGLDILKNADLRGELADCRQPILTLFGKMDAMVPAKLATYFDEWELETHMIEKAGHAPFLTHPDTCLEIINSWMLQNEF